MNITVGEIIGLLGIMLRISIEPRIMGEHPSYFVEDPMINLGCGHYVQLRGYDAWEKYIMTLIRLKHICIALYLESGTSFCGEKLHHLC